MHAILIGRRPIVVGAVIGALVPALLFALVAATDETTIGILIFAVWAWVALPGALLAPVQGFLTMLIVELFWIMLGTLAGILFFTLRRRRFPDYATRDV